MMDQYRAWCDYDEEGEIMAALDAEDAAKTYAEKMDRRNAMECFASPGDGTVLVQQLTPTLGEWPIETFDIFVEAVPYYSATLKKEPTKGSE